MKPARTLRTPRAKTIAIYTAGAASVTAAVVASSLLMTGCRPCTKPEGCTPKPPTPYVTILTTPMAGTYEGPQLVSISAPGAQSIYYSTDGSTPGLGNCTAWDGTPIPVNDSTQLRVLANADGVNYLSNSLQVEYKLNTSAYTNRTALNAWLLLEKNALTALYCANNGCSQPPVSILQEEFHWSANCAQGGSVLFDNDPSTLTSTFTYLGCASNGLTADGTVALTLNAAKLPAISIDGSGGVIVNGAGYTANIADHTVRKYGLTGIEGVRQGNYDVSCSGAGCTAGAINYFYNATGGLLIKDPAVTQSCTQ